MAALAAYGAAFLLQPLDPSRRSTSRFSPLPPGRCTTACAASAGKSRVVRVRNGKVFTEKKEADSAVALSMLTAGMLRLTGESSPDRAWKALFRPDDRVGIKVNALGGRQIATRPGVVAAVVAGLASAGVPEENIIIWDRLTGELERAGYAINTSPGGVKCFGTDRRYDSEPQISGSVGSCFSSILSSRCTALISVPVLKDHDLSGVSVSLKNFYGAIHNPNKYHDNNCDPYIADLNCHPYIRDKLRLIVCDGLTMQYHGGPAYKSRWSLVSSAVLLSRDPVALDRIASTMIDEERKRHGLPALKDELREPVHIATAARKGLGTDDLSAIDLITLS